MNTEKIGKYIAGKRKALGLTQMQLAEKLGMSDKSVSKWERGVCLPDVSVYLELCKILGISLNEFLAGEDLVQDVIEKQSEETILQVTKDSKSRKQKLKRVIAILICLCLLLVSLSAFLFFQNRPKVNYLQPLDRECAEMNIAQMLSGVDGAYLYRYVLDDSFREITLHLTEYRNGKLLQKEAVAQIVFSDAEQASAGSGSTEGMIAIVPDFDAFRMQLIIAGDGAKYEINLEMDDMIRNLHPLGRTVSSAEDRQVLTPNQEIGLLALVISDDFLSDLPLADFESGALREGAKQNDCMYYFSAAFR